MKRIVAILSMLALFFVVTDALAIDKVAISTNVENIVVELDAGVDAASFQSDSCCCPYVFIMEEDGKLLVHPSFQGESLKEMALPVYQALVAADPSGVWIQYEWKDNIKNTFTKRSKNNLIVCSGY
jgi:hypothetical protein